METLLIGGVPMILRREYLNQLTQWKDEQVIKVVTGFHKGYHKLSDIRRPKNIPQYSE